jgi:hypothetical protein
MIGVHQQRRFIMFRFLKFSLLGLALALPFAMPQCSEAAAPAGSVVIIRRLPPRPMVVWYPGWFWHGRVIIRR